MKLNEILKERLDEGIIDRAVKFLHGLTGKKTILQKLSKSKLLFDEVIETDKDKGKFWADVYPYLNPNLWVPRFKMAQKGYATVPGSIDSGNWKAKRKPGTIGGEWLHKTKLAWARKINLEQDEIICLAAFRLLKNIKSVEFTDEESDVIAAAEIIKKNGIKNLSRMQIN